MSDVSSVISGSEDTTLRVWNIESGSCLHILGGHEGMITCLVSHGDHVSSGNDDQCVRVWNISNGQCVHKLEAATGLIYSMTYSDEGKYIIAGGTDGTVNLWDFGDGYVSQSFIFPASVPRLLCGYALHCHIFFHRMKSCLYRMLVK